MTLWTVLIPVAAGLALAALWWVGKAMLEGAREGLQEADAELAQERAERDAQAARDADARRAEVEAAALALSDADRFALNLRAPFTSLWLDIFETATHRPTAYFYQVTPPGQTPQARQEALRELAASLESGWGITDHASAMSSLAWLLGGGGHHEPYQQVRRALHGQNTAGLDRRHVTVVRQWEPEVGDVGGLAFDLARAADIAAQGVALGYLSDRQGWQVLGQCRQVAREAPFRDWAHYGRSFQAGAAFWNANPVRNRGYADAVKALLTRDDSPWRRDPWPPPGQPLNRGLAAVGTSSEASTLN